MAAQGGNGLDFLTRRHGVKIVSVASVEACCLGVGEVVGHQNILSASRMNGATVIFLNTVERANEVVVRGISIDDILTPVLPLMLPSKKVTISNIPPFLSDDIVAQALSRYGKLVSPIKKIVIGCESPLLKHIVSFRRFAFMIIKDDAELDLALKFRVDNFEYVVFVTTDKMKCFGCGKSGHLIRSCPDKSNAAGGSKDSAANEEDRPTGKPSEVGPAEAVATADEPAGEGTSVLGPVEAGSTSAESMNEGKGMVVMETSSSSNSVRARNCSRRRRGDI
ncbi:ras-related protein Rab-36 isoform X1 [Siniperca chuatsi]|uniref:ras-related protein Rab-36 isoform X1 n=1 Tax=Siniperca chuatsi TaxID=119488 RepID=UPI001CE13293|nr:ras-related protein Rab-36 isoform X1 [Siniperca chuatsi]